MATSSIPTNLPCELQLSCDMDIIYVDSSYKVPVSQAMSCGVIFKVDNYPITPEAYHIDCIGITGAKHSVDDKGILTVIFPEGCQVLKNAQISVSAMGRYKTSTQMYTADGLIRIMPVISHEALRLIPSTTKIKCDEFGKYTPNRMTVGIERSFAEYKDVLSLPYKDYHVTYSYGDNPYTEITVASTGITDIKKSLKGRMPDHMMLNLYNNAGEVVPIQSIRIPIYQDTGDTSVNISSGVKVELDNENDCVMTGFDYVVATTMTLQTRAALYVGGKQIPFTHTDTASVTIKTVDKDEEPLLEEIIITTDIVEETGELAIKYKFPPNIKIPKKMVNEWTLTATDPDGIKYTGRCIFNITAIPAMQAIYQIKTNGSVIRVNQSTGKRGPATIIVEKYKWTGDLHELTDYGFILYSKDHGDTQGYEAPILCDDVEECLKIEYYGPDGVLLDEETIHVIYDGRIPPEADCDIIAEQHKFYLATDYDSSNGVYPLPGDNWVSGDYTLTDWGEEKPYLWTFEETTYINIGKNRREKVTTRPVVYQRYAKGIHSITTYFYSGPEDDGIGCAEVSGTWFVTGTKGGTNLAWSVKNTKIDIDNPYQWTFTVYEYTEGMSTHSEPHISAIFTKNGDDGKAGIMGCVIRKTEWEDDKTYYNDMYYNPDDSATIRYIDVVYDRSNDKWFQMRTYAAELNAITGEAVANKVYTDSTEKYAYYGDSIRNKFGVKGVKPDADSKDVHHPWTLIKEEEPLMTPLIIAKNAVFELAQGNEFLLMNQKGQVVGGLSGYEKEDSDMNIRFFVGTQLDRNEYSSINDDLPIINDNEPAGAAETGDPNDNTLDQIQSIKSFYDKQTAPFRVYENGAFAATNAQIAGDLVNNPDDGMFCTEIKNNEIVYRPKSGNAIAAFMPILNPYVKRVEYTPATNLFGQEKPESGVYHSPCFGNKNEFIPSLVFFDPSGNVGSWIDYRGLHVNSLETNEKYEVNYKIDMADFIESLNQNSDITLDPDTNNIKIQPKQSDASTVITGNYVYTMCDDTGAHISDAPVSVVEISTFQESFDSFDTITEEFIIYPYEDYNYQTMLMDTEYTLGTLFSPKAGEYTFYNKERNTFTTAVTGSFMDEADVDRSLIDAIGSIIGIKPIEPGIDLTGSDQSGDSPNKVLGDEPDTGKPIFGIEYDDTVCNNYKIFINWRLRLFLSSYSNNSASAKSLKNYINLNGNILTLYQKRGNRGIYYLDSACTIKASYRYFNEGGVFLKDPLYDYDNPNNLNNAPLFGNMCKYPGLNFPITSATTSTIAIKASALYDWFDVDYDKPSEKDHEQSRAPGIITNAGINSGAFNNNELVIRKNWFVQDPPKKISYYQIISLISLHLYHTMYEQFPYYMMFDSKTYQFKNLVPNFLLVSSYNEPTNYSDLPDLKNAKDEDGISVYKNYVHRLYIPNASEFFKKTKEIGNDTYSYAQILYDNYYNTNDNILNLLTPYFEDANLYIFDDELTSRTAFSLIENIMNIDASYVNNSIESTDEVLGTLPNNASDDDELSVLRDIIDELHGVALSDNYVDSYNPNKPDYIFFRPQIIFEDGIKKEYLTWWKGTYDPTKADQTHKVYVDVEDLVFDKEIQVWMQRYIGLNQKMYISN